ncbi:hypothetical protein PV327_006693 [Microctonus hyperodae]|uniref:Uncharacterized protein n=1 Tax=Microctonus hyperodae TaxID=165561 RepID=A0AA39KIN1_MICHY|nr:hypothetical protein PV327_006693 [Microctonus hyperodae]
MMADNVHRKSHKQSDGNRKISNTIHRTTTETIRLGEPDRTHPALGLSVPSNITPNNQCKKKTSSFQITSVTVGNRLSNDAGEDSNDDLDESHGEDNSIELSRITDIETPSYSEDTFSKEDVFFNASNAALSTAPVIPTSSQYGLAIVPSEGGNVNNSTNDSNINTLDIASVTDNNIINLLSSNAKQDTDIREVHSHGRNERFKVVKIESTEPFKRGRWMCMDYLDHTNNVNQSNAISTPKISDPNEVCISYGVTDGVIIALDSSKSSINNDDKGITIDMNGHATHQDIHSSIALSNNQTGGYNHSVNNSMTQNVQHNTATVQTQPQVQQPPQIPQYFPSSAQQQQLASQQQQQQQPQGGPPSQQQQQGSTLPANLQNAHPSNLGQPQSMPQGSIPIITQTNNNNVTPQQNISHTNEDGYVTVGSQNQSMQNVCQSSVQQQQQPQSSAPTSQATNILVNQHQSQQQQQQQPLTTQKPMTQISEPMNAMQGMQGIQNIHKVPQSSGQQSASAIHQVGGGGGGGASGGSGQPQVQTQVLSSTQIQPQTASGNAPVQMNQVSANCQNVGVGGMQQGNMAFHQPDGEQESMPGIITGGTGHLADAALLECLAEVTLAGDDHQTLEDNESMSGTNAVAIDNKIEQAMDLVKSHLMFAVREEVEVLKEKIAELMDRINQLEAENLILKAHATTETLAQLSQSTTKLSQTNSGNGQ